MITLTSKIQSASLEEIVENATVISNGLVAKVEMLKEYPFQPFQDELCKLLTEDTIHRFLSIISTLDVPYTIYKNDEHLTFENNLKEKGLLMQSWSTLGSALESLLQIFLSVYLEQYLDSNWGVWSNQEIENAKVALNNALDELVKNEGKEKGKGISGKRKKRLKDEINKFLKEKSEICDLKSITLYDLLAFYKTNKVFKNNEADEWTKELNKIREYRNGIHSFQDRTIGHWDEYEHSVKIFLVFLIDIYNRFPSVEDQDGIVLSEIHLNRIQKANNCCYSLLFNLEDED